ncbi:lactate dehydrogenase (plasmid) [Erysipelothrix larvae]|uniref:Lactate dehydrogenase n=1 Tax=Erysipelothrix larvae TaxID=1514105 RepID=A0A0X8H222_9FIRM|nr:2-hydroxyacid dehydrogenase [Erysipelothrix larvae]AMC93767.1 lactate dehydrogenase [Erysipelothrix larvae]AMC94689.1 lactate dehydrogenase [Erysipelothrix larvae]
MKLLCYGVRRVERPFFEDLNARFNFDLVLTESMLNDETVHLAKGCDAVMLRGGCPGSRQNLQIYKDYGVQYVLTRTVGYNHIDLDAAKDLGLKVAYVPFYSPNAIAELALTFAMTLSRHVQYMGDKGKDGNLIIDEFMFSKEVRKSTVGIIGLGKIGFTAAQLFHGIGANVIGYDIVKKDYLGDVCTQVDLDTLLKESDIISMHMPYFKGSNDEFLNAEKIEKMKEGVILINTSRGELQKVEDILSYVESGKIQGYATDVLANETQYFNKLTRPEDFDVLLTRIQSLYPRVLVTPHIGSYTDEAVSNMVEYSYENLQEFIDTGKSKNQLV